MYLIKKIKKLKNKTPNIDDNVYKYNKYILLHFILYIIIDNVINNINCINYFIILIMHNI